MECVDWRIARLSRVQIHPNRTRWHKTEMAERRVKRQSEGSLRTLQFGMDERSRKQDEAIPERHDTALQRNYINCWRNSPTYGGYV